MYIVKFALQKTTTTTGVLFYVIMQVTVHSTVTDPLDEQAVTMQHVILSTNHITIGPGRRCQHLNQPMRKHERGATKH